MLRKLGMVVAAAAATAATTYLGTQFLKWVGAIPPKLPKK